MTRWGIAVTEGFARPVWDLSAAGGPDLMQEGAPAYGAVAAAYPAPAAAPAYSAAPAAPGATLRVRPDRAGHDAELLEALYAVVDAGASDLHITAGATPMIRVDGSLRPVPGASVWSRE